MWLPLWDKSIKELREGLKKYIEMVGGPLHPCASIIYYNLVTMFLKNGECCEMFTPFFVLAPPPFSDARPGPERGPLILFFARPYFIINNRMTISIYFIFIFEPFPDYKCSSTQSPLGLWRYRNDIVVTKTPFVLKSQKLVFREKQVFLSRVR